MIVNYIYMKTLQVPWNKKKLALKNLTLISGGSEGKGRGPIQK